MTPAAQTFEPQADPMALRNAFLKWQCLTRQISVRQNQGRPDEAVGIPPGRAQFPYGPG